MAEPHTVPRADDRADEALALTPDLVRDILDAEDAEAVRAKLAPLHAADVADLLERIAPDQRSTVLDAIRGVLDPDILAELDGTVRGEVVEQMAPQELARAVAGLDDDDAAEVVADLDEETRREILARLPQPDRAAVEQALAYDDDTVGRLMQRATVVVPAYWTVGEAIDYLRADASLPDVFFDIFVVDPRHRPVGSLPLSRILRNRRPVGLVEIMDDEPVVLTVSMDQEEAAFLFRQQDLTSAPVVDELDGQEVELPGFVVPLDFEGSRTFEFLLVPFFGACIHVPPPPPNQIVFVKTATGYPLKSLFETVTVTGVISTQAHQIGVGDAGYTMQATLVEPL